MDRHHPSVFFSVYDFVIDTSLLNICLIKGASWISAVFLYFELIHKHKCSKNEKLHYLICNTNEFLFTINYLQFRLFVLFAKYFVSFFK